MAQDGKGGTRSINACVHCIDGGVASLRTFDSSIRETLCKTKHRLIFLPLSPAGVAIGVEVVM